MMHGGATMMRLRRHLGRQLIETDFWFCCLVHTMGERSLNVYFLLSNDVHGRITVSVLRLVVLQA